MFHLIDFTHYIYNALRIVCLVSWIFNINITLLYACIIFTSIIYTRNISPMLHLQRALPTPRIRFARETDAFRKPSNLIPTSATHASWIISSMTMSREKRRAFAFSRQRLYSFRTSTQSAHNQVKWTAAARQAFPASSYRQLQSTHELFPRISLFPANLQREKCNERKSYRDECRASFA